MRRTLSSLLGRYSGNLNISIPGEVVSGLIISNGVQIEASNVTLENWHHKCIG
jgi:hypothetical protein